MRSIIAVILIIALIIAGIALFFGAAYATVHHTNVVEKAIIVIPVICFAIGAVMSICGFANEGGESYVVSPMDAHNLKVKGKVLMIVSGVCMVAVIAYYLTILHKWVEVLKIEKGFVLHYNSQSC